MKLVKKDGQHLECSQKKVADALTYAFKVTDINLIDIGIQSGATACAGLLVFVVLSYAKINLFAVPHLYMLDFDTESTTDGH